MTRRLVLASTLSRAPAPAPGQTVVITDTAWRPDEGARDDLLPLGPAVRRVLTTRDPFAEARGLLDTWAGAVDLDQATAIDGIAWWYRRRLGIWLLVVRSLHWRAILDELRHECWPTETLVVPAGDQSLVDVARLLAARDGLALEISGDDAGPTARAASTSASDRRRDVWGRLLRRAGRHPDQRRARERTRRDAVLQERVATLREEGSGRLLVLVAPRIAQPADLPDGRQLVDPFLDPILRACAGTRLEPISLALGTGPDDDARWPGIEANARCLPLSALEQFWSKPGDRAAARQTAADVSAALKAMPQVPMLDGGVDLSPLVREHLARWARTSLPKSLVLGRRSARMMADLGLAGVLLINEYSRREFVAAARSMGIPAFAVQHGIIYPGHVGYVHQRTDRLLLPTRTFVFGPYEADVLMRRGGYREDEVEVTGAPRIAFVSGDLEATIEPSVRADVRRRLGVADGDRMLVVSTTHEQMHRNFYWANSLGQLFDGPLPGVHVVFKQHPSERDDGGYQALVEDIARRAGAAAPPVTVVRDIDLYTLLRAADAHLGLFSTVLTDAVAAGTPNLVATTQARRDLLGYVEAGVASPVSSNAELCAALRDCSPPAPAARAAFLDRHMLRGDAPGRIRDAILAATARPRPGTTYDPSSAGVPVSDS